MRQAKVKRRTKETDISIALELDNHKSSVFETNIGFLNHMLDQLCTHGGFYIELKCKGDTEVDYHHTVEDIAITLGQAMRKAIESGKPIQRYGHFSLPMDETLVQVVLDINKRPLLVYNTTLSNQKVGDFDVELIQEFMRAFANHLGMTLHINVMYGENLHHICEAIFKCCAYALAMAIKEIDHQTTPISTKGVL